MRKRGEEATLSELMARSIVGKDGHIHNLIVPERWGNGPERCGTVRKGKRSSVGCASSAVATWPN